MKGKSKNKQIEELKSEIEELKKISEERLNQLKYLQADFENYRKKMEKEKKMIIELANEALIKELLIILDDFEAAIKFTEDDVNKEGLIKIQKKFFDILSNYGLKEIESLGKIFNPNFHEALCKEASEHKEGEIIEEIQKGYLLHSKLLRPSKVKISK